MQVVLQIDTEGRPSHKIWLRDNQSAEVGRVAWADLAVSDDPEMADVHFALQCKDAACRIRNLSPSGGTLVNGDRVVFSELSDGDEVRAGKTLFRVTIEDDRRPTASRATTANRTQAPPSVAVQPSVDIVGRLSSQEPLCVALELESGLRAGCFVWMRDNQTLQVGRSCFADFAVESDGRLEPLHFELVTDWSRCLLRRLSPELPVLVNGQPTTATVELHHGDRIQAGDSHFAVRISGGANAGQGPEAGNAHPTPGAKPPCSYRRLPCPSGLTRFVGDNGEQTVLDMARQLAEHWPMYLVVNFNEAKLPIPESLHRDGDLHGSDAKSSRARGRLLLISPNDPLDPFELWQRALGTQSVSCLFTELSRTDLLSRLRRHPVSFNTPTILYHHLAELPGGFSGPVIEGIQAVLLEREGADAWAVLTQDDDDSAWERRLVGDPGRDLP